MFCCVGVGAGVGASSTASASTAQIAEAAGSNSADPAWKYCTQPDKMKNYQLKSNFCDKKCSGGITRIKLHLAHIPKSNVAKCGKVPSDVKKEMYQLLTKTNDVKESKTKELQRVRAEVNLNHPKGEASSEEDDENSIVVLNPGRARSGSSSKDGPIERFYKGKPEETIAAKKGTNLSKKVQTKLSTQKREERRDRACGYICQFFYEAGIAHHAVTLPSFNLMLEAIGDFGRNLDGPSAHGMVVLPTPLI